MTTLEECVNLFLKVDRSPYTTDNYRRIMTRMMEAIGLHRSIELVRHEDLLDYLQLLRKRDLKRRSLEQYITSIKIFFRWLVTNGYLPTSPAEVMRLRSETPEALPARAMPAKVLADMIEYTRNHARNHAIIMFLADTGCRVGGIVNLEIKNLDLDERSAMTLEKGGRWVYLYFSEETQRALERWLKKRPACDHDIVFTTTKGKPLRRQGYRGLVERLSLRVTDGETAYRPHSIRHAVGNSYAERFVPSVTAKKLNHTNIATTMKFYYPQSDELIQQISQDNPLLSAQPPQRREDAKIVQFPRNSNRKRDGQKR